MSTATTTHPIPVRSTRVDDTKPAASRDDDLDVMRGLTMVWLVAMHCLYLSGVLRPEWDVVKSWAICPLMAIFFVAGAAAGLTPPRPALWSFVARLARVLVPYWVFAALCLAIEARFGVGLRAMNETYLVAWALPLVTPPGSLAITPAHWALWFLPVYIGVFAVFPLCQGAHRALAGRWRVLPLIGIAALVFLTERLTGFERARHVLFYSFWAYLGLSYPVLKARPWPRAAVLAVSLGGYAALAALILRGHATADMQTNKFPPNLAFLCYGLGQFGLLALVYRPLLRAARAVPLRWLVAPYRSYGYTIYLYHSFVFVGWYHLRMNSTTVQWMADAHPVLTVLLMMPLAIMLVPVVTRPFARFERFRLRLPDPGVARQGVGAPHVRKAVTQDGAAAR